MKFLTTKSTLYIGLLLLTLVCGTVVGFNYDDANLGSLEEAIKLEEPHIGTCGKEEFRYKVDGKCYPKVFVPTKDFKNIIEGQVLPKGLHSKMNLETGLKMAKLFDSSAPNASPNEIVLHPDQPSNSKPYELRKGILSKRELFNDYVSLLKTEQFKHPSLNAALEGLEDLVHDLEFGEDIIKSNVFKNLLDLLRPIWPSKNRANAAKVIGSALQNNPKAHLAAHQWNLPSKFLDYLAMENQQDITARFLYALSAIIRSDELAQQAFHQSSGLTSLHQIYKLQSKNAIHRKILNLVADLFDPNMRVEGKGSNSEPALLDPKLDQSFELWCDDLQNEIATDPENALAIEQINALTGLALTYPTKCKKSQEFKKLVKETSKKGWFKSHKLDEETRLALKKLEGWASN